MKIIPDPLSFAWDKGNLDKNFKKHGVTNKEAENVFENKPIFIFADEKHSTLKEKRYGAFGVTNQDRLLSVVFTVRNEYVRIITARNMSRKERRAYEKIKNNSKL